MSDPPLVISAPLLSSLHRYRCASLRPQCPGCSLCKFSRNINDHTPESFSQFAALGNWCTLLHTFFFSFLNKSNFRRNISEREHFFAWRGGGGTVYSLFKANKSRMESRIEFTWFRISRLIYSKKTWNICRPRFDAWIGRIKKYLTGIE